MPMPRPLKQYLLNAIHKVSTVLHAQNSRLSACPAIMMPSPCAVLHAQHVSVTCRLATENIILLSEAVLVLTVLSGIVIKMHQAVLAAKLEAALYAPFASLFA